MRDFYSGKVALVTGAASGMGRTTAIEFARAGAKVIVADIAEADDFFLVFPAIDALGRIRDSRVAPRLLPLLQRRDVVEPVADALGELGGADVVRPLVDVLNATGPATPIARALARLHERYEQQYGGGALIVTEFQSAIRPPGSQRVLDALAADEATQNVPVVMMTGSASQENLERADRAGVLDFLSKPFEPVELVSTIHHVLEMTEEREVVGEAS